MDRARIAKYVASLPEGLKHLLDSELAAGNEVTDVELGSGEDEGKVAVILNYPFRGDRGLHPSGVRYRELKNRDPMIFEFYTSDGKFSLVTAKFKTVKLTEVHGPPDPTEAHIAMMKKRAEEEKVKAARRRELARQPPPPRRQAALGESANRFLTSMNITYEMWHDGIGYDLDALNQIPASELPAIERLLIEHRPRDWRDIEALAQIDSPTARKEVEAALKDTDAKVRQEAMQYAGDKADPAERERLLIHTLRGADLFTGLSEAIDECEEFHPPAVIDALFRGALNRDGEAAVHFAAMLFYLHGKAKEPFDWDHRPFFLRFNTSDRKERKAVFHELCEIIGVDPKKYVR
jgi:hypothetical protein